MKTLITFNVFEVENFLFVMTIALRVCENFLGDFENTPLRRADNCLNSCPEVSWPQNHVWGILEI